MRIAVKFVLFLGLLIAVLFGSAGTWNLPLYWAYIGVLFTAMLVALLVIDPKLREERLKPGAGGTDRALRWAVMPFFLAHMIIAALDVGRFHWSDTIPFALRVAGLVGLAASMALSTWAMYTNQFFSPVVRIQSERGHHVITGGPYRFIRHPGYLASFASMLFGGLVLGSWIAFAPLIVTAAFIVRRIRIEDEFLLENLDGYRDYAARVRYRLLPGVY